MIFLKKERFEEILAHLRKEYPNEGCGLLSGKQGKAERVHGIKNVDASPVSFLMDPEEELTFFKALRETGAELVGIFHSHPTSEAYPSEKDRSLAFFEDVFYLIVSLKEREEPVARVFWIREGKIQEDRLEIESFAGA